MIAAEDFLTLWSAELFSIEYIIILLPACPLTIAPHFNKTYCIYFQLTTYRFKQNAKLISGN